MRSCGLLVLAACAVDPSLDISVQHPAIYAVTRTTVTVYVGVDLTCSQIEFGDLTDSELAALEVDSIDVTPGAHIEVSRLGGKSLVARGYDVQGRFVTAGCEDKGEIAGATKVEIVTRPTAVVAIDPSLPDRPFSERAILVNVTDIHGQPLEGTVSWELTGPADLDDHRPTEGVVMKDGDATIRVADLGTPGPQALRIRVPWAIAQLPLVTAFDLSRATTIMLGGGNLSGRPSCDVRGRAGKPPTLVCLSQADLQGHRDAVEIEWQTNRFVATPIPIPRVIDNQFALFVDHDGSADEPVYVISADAAGVGHWYKLGTPCPCGTPACCTRSMVFGNGLKNVVYVPRCRDNSVAALVGIQTGTTVATLERQAFYTTSGAQVVMPVEGEVLAGGCISDTDKQEHQAVVVTSTGDAVVAALVLIASNNQMRPIPGTRLPGSGFVAVETQGMIEKRFAGTRLQASGTVVFEAVLTPERETFKLIERTERDAAAPPIKIISGKLDRDDDTDLMWDMNAGLRRHAFQVSLAKRVRGLPLTAMTTGGTAGTVNANRDATDFLAADLDGQGTDEMVLFSAAGVTIYSPD